LPFLLSRPPVFPLPNQVPQPLDALSLASLSLWDQGLASAPPAAQPPQPASVSSAGSDAPHPASDGCVHVTTSGAAPAPSKAAAAPHVSELSSAPGSLGSSDPVSRLARWCAPASAAASGGGSGGGAPARVSSLAGSVLDDAVSEAGSLHATSDGSGSSLMLASGASEQGALVTALAFEAAQRRSGGGVPASAAAQHACPPATLPPVHASVHLPFAGAPALAHIRTARASGPGAPAAAAVPFTMPLSAGGYRPAPAMYHHAAPLHAAHHLPASARAHAHARAPGGFGGGASCLAAQQQYAAALAKLAAARQEVAAAATWLAPQPGASFGGGAFGLAAPSGLLAPGCELDVGTLLMLQQAQAPLTPALGPQPFIRC
jgi:hypothetical protein